jgi:hypothetical protein
VSTLREIWIHCYERFGFIVTRDLVFESHTPAVYFYRRYELTADSNLSTFLFSTFPIGHTHPRPSLLSTTSSPLSPVYSDGGGSAPNDGHLCLLYTSLLVIHIPVHLYSPRLRRRFRRSILTAVMLGLRSANEWKHGATRSAITTEQIPTAGYATLYYILSRNGPYN